MMYTRNGKFIMTAEGCLVDSDGNHLQGANGDVHIPVDAADVGIKLDGSVYADGVKVDTIELVDFADYAYLELYGKNMYKAVDGAVAMKANGTTLQGFLEQSNVNVIDQMVSMITITRAYETNQKMIQTQDNLIGKAVSDVGRV